MRLRKAGISGIALVFLAASSAMAQSFDFAFYKEKVEPIFLKRRAGHARCVVCHSVGRRAFTLQPLAPGTTSYTAEQSKRNFESASNLAVPGNVAASPLLIHPLAPEAGGDRFHSGGRQFRSKDDPDWKTLAEWVTRAKSK